MSLVGASSRSPVATASASAPDPEDNPFQTLLQTVQRQQAVAKQTPVAAAAPVGPRISKGKASLKAADQAEDEDAASSADSATAESEPVAKPTELEAQVAAEAASQPAPQTPAAAANAPAAPTPRPARPAGKSTVGNQPNTVAKPSSPKPSVRSPAVSAVQPADRAKTRDQSDKEAPASEDQPPPTDQNTAAIAVAAAAPPSVNVVSSAEALPSAPQVPTATHDNSQVATSPRTKTPASASSPRTTKPSAAAPAAIYSDSTAASSPAYSDIAAPAATTPAPDGSVIQAAAATAIAAPQTPNVALPSAAPVAPAPPPASPETAFAAANHPQIVTGVHGQLLPDGGTMTIRLAPPELGDLQVTVQVSNGAVAAAFATSNDQTTRLLSHTLSQLKTALESAGVSVEKLQVSQMPRDPSRQEPDSQSSGKQSGDDQTGFNGETAARDQQRREMLRRMWKRVSGNDDLDLIA